VTLLWVGEPEDQSSILDEDRGVFHHLVQGACRTHPVFCALDNGGFSPRVKRYRRVTNIMPRSRMRGADLHSHTYFEGTVRS
jgi:hypothetical protein